MFVYFLIVVSCLSSVNCKCKSCTKKAVVFGGGPSGLTAAMELREAGFHVRLYEKMERFGGKMVGYVNDNQLPREHAIRVYHKRYLALGDVFNRAGLKPPTRESPNASPTFSQLESPVVSTAKGFAFTQDEILGKLGEFGVTTSEFQYFIFQMRAYKVLPSQTINKLFDVKFSDFIDSFAFTDWKSLTNCTAESDIYYCNQIHTAGFHKLIETWMAITVAAIPEDSAPPVLFTLNTLIDKIVPFDKQACSFVYEYFHGKFVATGPTSNKIIDPWVNYIRSKGVKMYTRSKLLSFKITNQTIKSADIKQRGRRSKRINADIFIMALPVEDSEFILPGITQGRSLSNRWSFGVQFYLPCLPEEFLFYSDRSMVTVVWDSPYSMVYMIQSPHRGMWMGAGFELKDGVEFVLSVAISNTNRIGVLNDKSFLNSTRKEALADALAQIHFPEKVQCSGLNGTFDYKHKNLIKTANLGLLLEDQYDEFYQQNKAKKYRTADVGPVKEDGKRWILHAPLYVPKPAAKQISPITKYPNVVLAGDYVATPLMCNPTMEHAAESGKLAAQAAIEKFNIKHEIPKVNLLKNLVGADSIVDYDEKIKQGILIGEC